MEGSPSGGRLMEYPLINCRASRGATRSKFRRGQIEGGARTEGAKRPRIEGEARTESEARDKAGGGVRGGGSVSPPQKIFENFILKPCNLVYSLNNNQSFLTSIFVSHFLVFFHDEKVCGKSGDLSIYRRAKCIRGGIWGVVSLPKLNFFTNPKIKICKSMVVECIFIILRWK